MQKYPEAFRILVPENGIFASKRYLTDVETARLLSKRVVVEEKLDGSLVGLSWKGGQPFAQAKGRQISPLEPTSEYGHGKAFHRLWPWIWDHVVPLEKLPKGHTIFGEWLLARHSVAYDRLPDLFVAFDVMDREGRMLHADAKRTLLDSLRIPIAPSIREGPVRFEDIPSLAGQSAFGDVPAEGVVIKNYELGLSGKYVTAEFFNGIEENWLRLPWSENGVAPRSAPVGPEPHGRPYPVWRPRRP